LKVSAGRNKFRKAIDPGCREASPPRHRGGHLRSLRRAGECDGRFAAFAYRGNDVIVFQILDPAELRFDFPNAAQFVDMETGAEMHVIRITFARNTAGLLEIRRRNTRRSAGRTGWIIR